jgi:hypothetical protein
MVKLQLYLKFGLCVAGYDGAMTLFMPLFVVLSIMLSP